MSGKKERKSKGFIRTTKHLHSIARLIREIFIYGNKSRRDFEALGCDDRSFDDQRRRITACIEDRFIDFSVRSDKSKCWKFKTDLYHNSYNYLIETYRIKTITANLYWELILMQILSAAEIPLTKNDIFETFNLDNKILKNKRNTSSDDILFSPDVNVVNRTLEKLLKYGWISEIKDSKPYKYIRTKSIFDDLSFDEISELYQAVTFHKNDALLTVPGYYLEKTLEDYCQQKFQKQLTNSDHFQFRFYNYTKILDDRTNYIVQKAIVAKKRIKMTMYNNPSEIILTPLSISTTYPYNKQQIKTLEGININLDNVETINIEASHNAQSQKVTNTKQHHRLELCFTFLSSDNPNEVIHIKNRLKQEASWMELIKDTETQLIYTALVNDSRKYVPWIRTFHKYVSFTKNTHSKLVQWVENDRREMLANYGNVL